MLFERNARGGRYGFQRALRDGAAGDLARYVEQQSAHGLDLVGVLQRLAHRIEIAGIAAARGRSGGSGGELRPAFQRHFERACRGAGEQILARLSVEPHAAGLYIVERGCEGFGQLVEATARIGEFFQRESGSAETAALRIDDLPADVEREQSSAGVGNFESSGCAALDEFGRRIAERNLHRPVGSEDSLDRSEARKLLQHQVALVEQRGAVARTRPGAVHAQIDPRQFLADDIGFRHLGLGIELKAVAHGIEPVGGDVELAGQRFRFAQHRRAARGIDGIARQLLQRGFEFDHGIVDAGLFERAFHVAQALKLDIRTRQIASGAADLALQEGIGIAADFRDPRARQRDVADPPDSACGGNLLKTQAATRIAVARRIGDVLRRHVERAARRAGAADCDGEEV